MSVLVLYILIPGTVSTLIHKLFGVSYDSKIKAVLIQLTISAILLVYFNLVVL